MRSVTGTHTYSRFSLLTTQVRALLREAANVSTDSLDRVTLGLRDPHYIEQVRVRGIYPNGEIGAELMLSIDWREHVLNLKAGGSELQMPRSWAGGVAPSVSEATRTFLAACERAGLKTEWVVVYASHFDRDEVNRILGFKRAVRREWRRVPDRLALGLEPLSEASLLVSLAID